MYKISISQFYYQFLAGAAILLMASICAYNFVFIQFGGYDLSLLIDMSWRLANNEIPGKDFINTMPLGLLIFVKLVSWGKLSWSDLTIANIIAVSLTYISINLISSPKNRGWQWHLSVALILSLPLVYTNHIWHSSLSQYFAIIFFYAVYKAIESQSVSKKILWSIFLASGTVALSKQNVSAPVLIFTSAFILFFEPKDKLRLIFVIWSGALIGVLAAMLFLHVSLGTFLYSYWAIFGRRMSDPEMWLEMSEVKSHLPLTGFMIAYLILFISSIRKQNFKGKSYFLMFLLISLIPIATDWDTKINNIPLPLFVFLTAIFASYQNAPSPWQLKTSMILLCGISVVSLVGGYYRERMMFVGPFYELPVDSKISYGYFADIRTGKGFENILGEMNRIKLRWPEARIYFGPRIEFGYMETGSKSPQGMPLWFHPGTSYALFDEEKVTSTFLRSKFEVLVFTKGRGIRSRIPSGILEYISENYDLDTAYLYLDVYKRKQ